MPTTAEKAVATDAAFSYYAAALSQNIGRTPEGYLICKDAVIGRTGKMQYMVSQLRREQLQDLGISDKFRDNDVVDLWRDPEEVFAGASLASYESKPVTDNHPTTFVNAKNHRTHHRGHVRNVRAGDQALSTGDLPILADVVITDEALAQDVLSGRRRELSCGYNYHLAYDGQRLSQVSITGNHVAVVAKGRAGAEARIHDAAPRKEYVVTRDTLISLGLSAMAKDNADPQALSAAVRAAYGVDAADPKPDKALEAKDAEITALRSELKKAEDALKARDEEDKKKDDEDDDEKKKKESQSEDADLLARLAALDEKDDEDDEDEDEDDDDDDEDEEEKKKKAKSEDADFVEPVGGDHDLRAQLREMRPLVARSKDAALRKRFNKLAAKANDSKRGGSPSGAYGSFREAAGTQSDAARDAANDAVTRLNARAQAAFRGEVK